MLNSYVWPVVTILDNTGKPLPSSQKILLDRLAWRVYNLPSCTNSDRVKTVCLYTNIFP